MTTMCTDLINKLLIYTEHSPGCHFLSISRKAINDLYDGYSASAEQDNCDCGLYQLKRQAQA
jgi:hypothetical protein